MIKFLLVIIDIYYIKHNKLLLTGDNIMESNKNDDDNFLDDIQKDLSGLLKNKYNINAVFGFNNKDNPFAEPPVEKDLPKEETPLNIDFNYKPKEVKEYLDRFIVKQEEAKKALSIAVCDHYNNISREQKGSVNKHYVKQNIVMAGPTGVGKTFLIKKIADLIGVPFIKGDATKYSETGYVGGDVEDLVRQLVKKADGNTDLAQYGIIYIDEVDKISNTNSPNSQRDVGGHGVQTNLLKLMEETEVPLATPWDIQSQLSSFMQGKSKKGPDNINTKNILFIVSGAFNSLDEIVKRRLKGSQIGFTNNQKEYTNRFEILKETSTEDFIKFGFEPEFVGRLPVRVFLEELGEKDLYKILKESEATILKQYIQSFENYGINVALSEDALVKISQEAIKENTGARSLGTVLEKTYRDFKFELPSTNIKHFLTTKELIVNPHKILTEIKNDPIKAAKDYFEQALQDQFDQLTFGTHLKVKLTKDGTKYIVDKCISERDDIYKYCSKLFSTIENGINIINQNLPEEDFLIDKELAENPYITLDKRIKNSYKKKE